MSSSDSIGSRTALLSGPFAKLQESEWVRKEPAIQLLLKLLQNIINDPCNLKLRRIKRSNATLQAKLFSVPGCDEFLQVVGFENDGVECLVLQDGADVAWAVEELQQFGNNELLQHLREERDRKIAIAKGAEAECKRGTVGSGSSLQHSRPHPSVVDDHEKEQAKLLHQLELDRKERAERQQMKQQRQTLHKLTQEREERTAKEKANGITELKDTSAEKDFWQTSKGKKKAWVQKKKGKKGRGRGNGSGNNTTNFGTGRGGKLSGYREIPIPCLGGFNRTEDREIAAVLAASAAESRTNRAELEVRRRQELENRQQRELQALAAHRTSRSRKLARECQEAAMRASANASADAAFPAPPILGCGDDVCEVSIHEVPADNSCLFHAIVHLIEPLHSNSASLSPASLRESVAVCMRREPERWSNVTLAEGRTVEEYSMWITHPSSWGGFVDLIVLSEYFRVQISVISLESLYWTHYPDDATQYNSRIYLLYDGVHYDAVVGRSHGSEVRVFNSLDEAMLDRIYSMARELQMHRQDQESSIYQCQECQEILFGQADVAKHSFDTCHCNFKEVALDDTEGVDTKLRLEEEDGEDEDDEDDAESDEEDHEDDDVDNEPISLGGQMDAGKQPS